MDLGSFEDRLHERDERGEMSFPKHEEPSGHHAHHHHHHHHHNHHRRHHGDRDHDDQARSTTATSGSTTTASGSWEDKFRALQAWNETMTDRDFAQGTETSGHSVDIDVAKKTGQGNQ